VKRQSPGSRQDAGRRKDSLAYGSGAWRQAQNKNNLNFLAKFQFITVFNSSVHKTRCYFAFYIGKIQKSD
jgi:hypothetical protein